MISFSCNETKKEEVKDDAAVETTEEATGTENEGEATASESEASGSESAEGDAGLAPAAAGAAAASDGSAEAAKPATGINAQSKGLEEVDVPEGVIAEELADTPVIYPGYNPDDGIFIGAGVMIKKHGFRKYPMKEKHVIKADIAPKSRSYDFSYNGTFTQVVGKWDLVINANIFAPSYTDYFYGYGNATKFDNEKFNVDSRYYSARYLQYIFYPEITRKSENELHQFTIGGGYQSANVKSNLNDLNDEQDRFIITYANSLNYQLLDIQRHYLALYGDYTFDNTNNEHMPLQGIKWNLFLIGLEDVDSKEKDIDFQRIRTDFSYYFTFGKFLKTTLAMRAGGVFTNGDYEFYHAAKIGGSNTFRGVRKFRLTGQHSFYQNTDIRVNLFNLRNPVLPTSIGLVLFHDFGRVWYYPDDPTIMPESSNKMHRAYGGGIWLAPLNAVSFGLDYSWSTLDESALFLRMGFLF